MSAPDPQEWKATEYEAQELHGTCYEDFNGDNMDHDLFVSLCERVARRRALAELKALFIATCEGCATGKACHYSNILSACPTQKIQDRIAAIEAEES